MIEQMQTILCLSLVIGRACVKRQERMWLTLLYRWWSYFMAKMWLAEERKRGDPLLASQA